MGKGRCTSRHIAHNMGNQFTCKIIMQDMKEGIESTCTDAKYYLIVSGCYNQYFLILELYYDPAK
jgi:hypothetical protein